MTMPPYTTSSYRKLDTSKEIHLNQNNHGRARKFSTMRSIMLGNPLQRELGRNIAFYID